jgi:16S rRNA (uracil1498-N3)-methyltransferase
MQRYFVDPEQLTGDKVTIIGEDAHHISNVMRLRVGDQVLCSNGQGRDVLAKIEQSQPKEVMLSIVEDLQDSRELGISITIAQALPKADKMEWILQKGTELGASRFVPFSSKRTVVQWDAKKESKKLERWAKIVKEAAEQSHRSRIPDIAPVMNWRSLLKLQAEAGLALLAYEAEEGTQIGDLVKPWLVEARQAAQLEQKPLHMIICIGPEGGFDASEVEDAIAAGWKPVGLGRRILRTETAAMAALVTIQTLDGEMGG